VRATFTLLLVPVEVHAGLAAVPATTNAGADKEEPVQEAPLYTPLIDSAVDRSKYGACPVAPVQTPSGTLLHVMAGDPEQPPEPKRATEKVPSAFEDVTVAEPKEATSKQPPNAPGVLSVPSRWLWPAVGHQRAAGRIWWLLGRCLLGLGYRDVFKC